MGGSEDRAGNREEAETLKKMKGVSHPCGPRIGWEGTEECPSKGRARRKGGNLFRF
jgi:hypothetical protein